jgi:dTDP-4-amino-4,6-dideoxygalactose transaminase
MDKKRQVLIPLVDLKVQYESIRGEMDRAVLGVIKEGGFIGGAYVTRFEEAFGAYCRAKCCVGVGNGTDALYIALRALGVGPKDEVITVANSFIATSEAITMTGARVVFVDCHPETYNIDAAKIEEAITKKTKAILPVHLYGQAAEMGSIMRIARKYGLYVVEDAAQAHGAEINAIRVGSIGNAACFSFYPGKNLGAYGDGGAIVTNDEKLATKCRVIANHGRVKKYDHDTEGVNSRLDSLQAAILHTKLDHLEEWTEKRRRNAQTYRQLLKDLEVNLPIELPGFRHVYHLFVIRIKERDAIQVLLNEKGIETGIHYPIALPNLAAYRYLRHSPQDFPVSTQYSQEILSLPLYPELTSDQIEYICRELKKAVLQLNIPGNP